MPFTTSDNIDYLLIEEPGFTDVMAMGEDEKDQWKPRSGIYRKRDEYIAEQEAYIKRVKGKK